MIWYMGKSQLGVYPRSTLTGNMLLSCLVSNLKFRCHIYFDNFRKIKGLKKSLYHSCKYIKLCKRILGIKTP